MSSVNIWIVPTCFYEMLNVNKLHINMKCYDLENVHIRTWTQKQTVITCWFHANNIKTNAPNQCYIQGCHNSLCFNILVSYSGIRAFEDNRVIGWLITMCVWWICEHKQYKKLQLDNEPYFKAWCWPRYYGIERIGKYLKLEAIMVIFELAIES